MKYGIIGSGAIGGYYGGRLAEARKDVHFLLHSDYEYVKQNGLKVDSIHGNFHLSAINAYKDTKDMPKCDIVLVGLKTTNNHLLKDLLPPLLKEDTIVILIQNGLGIEAEVQAMFPNLQIAGGLAFIASRKIKNGYIEHLDVGKLNIGTYSPNVNKLKLLNVISDLEEAKITAELVDLTTARWEKLIWNIPFNGMSVVMNTTTDELVNSRYTEQLLHDMMLEVIVAGNHCGANLSPKVADKMMEMTKSMKPYAPSMKLDFDNKRPLEIFSIYTKAIAEALLAGIDMPKVSMLEKQLRFIEHRYSNKK